MRKYILLNIWLLLLFTFNNINSQDNFCNLKLANEYLTEKGEVYFSFDMFDKARINSLSAIISIDNISDGRVFAYANKDEFENFIKLNIPYWILPHPGDADFDVNMKSDIDIMPEWDFYPTYEAYIAMMNQFAATYPNLCRIVNAGQTVQGRQILFAVVSDNVNTPEPEPKFMYTSSMHGDETTGYVLMLRLIDYLLTQYNINPKITNLVNNIEIWINPLANPDGTYHGGNSTVNGAVRYNANNRDLNRNFPDPTNPNPTPPFQPETLVMMNLAESKYFNLSANFHGGVEVVNYPWDTWSRLTTDNNWWVRVSRKYADTVHVYAVPGYMTFMNNGITNGYAWYRVIGGRQDYMCYYRHGRECTIEISNTSLLPPAQLPAHWNYNYRSFLNYMEQLLYGIQGTVTDSLTGAPLKTKVFISGFDTDSSEVYSDSLFGKYYRMIIQGTYSLTFSAPNYYSKTISGVYAKNDSTTILNVQLRPIFIGIAGNNEVTEEFKLYQNYPNPFNPDTKIRFNIPSLVRRGAGVVVLKIYDMISREVATLVNEQLQPGTYEVEWDGSNFSSGVYYYKLTIDGYTDTKKMVLIK